MDRLRSALVEAAQKVAGRMMALRISVVAPKEASGPHTLPSPPSLACTIWEKIRRIGKKKQ